MIVGGGAAGLETATFLAGYGVEVTLVHRGHRLLGREEPRVGELLHGYLTAAGMDVRLEASAARARHEGEDNVLALDDGSEVAAPKGWGPHRPAGAEPSAP